MGQNYVPKIYKRPPAVSLNGSKHFSRQNLERFNTYRCAQNKPIGRHIMKQNADFQEGISQA